MHCCTYEGKELVVEKVMKISLTIVGVAPLAWEGEGGWHGKVSRGDVW